jgi:CBS domain-containing protein
VTCGPDDTVEAIATLMHDNDVSRVPVVEDGRLVGIVARGDILRAIITPSE